MRVYDAKTRAKCRCEPGGEEHKIRVYAQKEAAEILVRIEAGKVCLTMTPRDARLLGKALQGMGEPDTEPVITEDGRTGWFEFHRDGSPGDIYIPD